MNLIPGIHRSVLLIDLFNQSVGRLLCWFTFAMMLLTCLLVALRYLVQGGNLVVIQEGVIYLHAAAFMLGSAWTLKRDGHVRVDIFYRKLTARKKAWVDSLGTLLFLMPFSLFLFFISIEFVDRSWTFREGSPEAGGIPALYVLKSFIPCMALLMLFQGISELIKNTLVLISTESA